MHVKCKYCKLTFKDNRGLSGHIRYKHKDQAAFKAAPKKVWPLKKPKPCPHCDKTYKNGGMLRDHIAAKHPDSAATVMALKCLHCQKHFKSQLWLNRHVATWHNSKLPTVTLGARTKSHLDLAIEEMQAEIAKFEAQADKLRDGLDVLMNARESLNATSA